MQSLIFRVLGGSLLTLAIVWALVLAWWQSNDHHPEPFELMLYLGVLPLALVGGYWLLRGFIEHLGRGAAALAADHLPAKDDDPLSRERMQSAAAERGMTVHLLDAFVASAGGNSGDAVLAAVNAGKRPEPNASLVDNDGFPVFAASISDPDVAALADELAERESCVAALGERQDIVRALVLLDNVLESATQGLASVLARCPHQLHVQLVWLIPADWDLSHQAELRRWIGTRSWPAAVPTDLEIHLIPTASEADAMRQLDEVIVAVNRDASPERLVLLMGAVSAVDQRTVEEWAAEGILFSGVQQDRQIPGEGAAVLMLAAPSTSAMLGCADAVAVTRVGHGLRESALNAGGRIGGRLIEQLAAGLLEVSGMAASSVQAVVSDTDHRAAHIVEMLEGLGTTFEHLDPLKDCLAVGAVTGALTPIGSLLALVCARQRAVFDAAPVLCLSNQHLRERAALLVMPCGAGADAAPLCS